jgi:hypothetical protein
MKVLGVPFGVDAKTYRAWCHMKSRCYNIADISYKDYGARGITVCEDWQQFENFLVDMGEAPQGTSLDRKDNNLGYCKENCRWATPIEQSNNRRAQSNNTGVPGVYWSNKQQAFQVRNGSRFLGTVKTLQQAIDLKKAKS